MNHCDEDDRVKKNEWAVVGAAVSCVLVVGAGAYWWMSSIRLPLRLGDLERLRDLPAPPVSNAVPVLLGIAAALGAAAVGLGIAWLRTRRRLALLERSPSPAMQAARLERIERAIDAVALEVERLGEMERSAARILSTRAVEREPRPMTPRPPPGHVITPH